MTKLTFAIVLALAAAVLAGPAAAKTDSGQGVGISSISPAVADRGGIVSITGNGFGATNVEVTVDGKPAEVISATGSKATFRVPALAGPGDTTVEATNPGGHVGTIGLHVLFDGVATPVVDEDDAVSATIGRGGGSLTTAGLTLTIPPEALSGDELITMTPLADLADSPLEGALIGGVLLEPQGLLFLEPAALTMRLPTGVAPEDVLGFGSDSDGSDLHLVPRTLAGGTITLELWHFSTGGASSGGSSAAAAVQSHTPSSAERQALQRIAAAHQACNAEVAQGIVNGPACANVVPESVRALFDWYINAVRPGLQGAGSAPSFDAEIALVEWLAWQAEVELLFRNSAPPVCGTLQNECDQAHGLATTAVGAHAQRRLDNCTGTSLPAQLRDVVRMADFAGAGAIDLTTLGLPDATNGDLLRECAHLKIAVTGFPAVAAVDFANTLRGRVTVDVFTGLDRTDVPFTLTVDGALVTAAADGTFQTTLTPTTGLPLNVRLEAEATNPSLQNTAFTDVAFLNSPTRKRLQLLAQGPTTIPVGGTVPLLILVAGDGMAGSNVALTGGGLGSLSSNSVTTNSQGEATALYTAEPFGPLAPNVVVIARLPDGTVTTLPITVQPPSVPITVDVTPSFGFVDVGQTLRFTATVTGTSDQRVSWNATGDGSISANGLYTAGSTPGLFTVTAVSLADPTSSDSATVQVSTTVEGRYIGTSCIPTEFGESCSSPDLFLDYFCFFQSNIRPGTTCGLSPSGAVWVPTTIPFCFIETDGTTAGGPFIGTVTSCRFGPASNYSAVRIDGTIGNGRLEISIYAPTDFGIQLIERITMTKVP